MTDKLTPKAQLLDLRLRDAGHPGLLDYIEQQRADAVPWRSIAAEVERIGGMRVTETGLRYWLDKAAEMVA